VWIPVLRRELAETRAGLAASRRLYLERTDPIGYRERIVCRVFGAAVCAKALSVTRCEARGWWAIGLPERATNGQYRGAWQMGSRERAKFGDAPDFYGQTRAAYRYYRLAGWSPWECA
jgi:hypothetical protein